MVSKSPQKALLVSESNTLESRLARSLEHYDSQILTIRDLGEFNQVSSRFDHIIIDQQSIANANTEELGTIQQLTRLSDYMIIARSDSQNVDRVTRILSEFADDDDETIQQIELVEHECRNVLQEMQMHLEIVKSRSISDSSINEQIGSIEESNHSLQMLLETAKFLRSPLILKRTPTHLGSLIVSTFSELRKIRYPDWREPKFELEDLKQISIDEKQMSVAIQEIFEYLFGLADANREIRVVDYEIAASESNGYRFVFQIFPRPKHKIRPDIWLSKTIKIVRTHGGRTLCDFDETSGTICVLEFPTEVFS